ncbi:MAG TPA: glycosyltransferase [Solirubrobacterales bacterium]|nr:glycosyltransferase [Solirubrobacterales bacterium]
MSEGPVPILYIAPWVDLGGSDKGTIDWFKSLDRDRWAPSLITTQPSANRWLRHVEPYAEEVWDLPDLMPGEAFPEFILGFIESRHVQVVHIMNSRLAFDLLPDISISPEAPSIVVQLHAEEPDQAGYVRYVTRRYGNLIDAFSVTSQHLKGVVSDYGIAPSRISVIYSGVDGEHEFNPSRVEPFALRRDASRILWPGRLVEQKDPMLTLDVIARARGRGAEFVLDIVGDGHLEEAVRVHAERIGVTDMIDWHPPSQEMARWYRSVDLVLMTSAYEGVPYVIYESLAMGVPIVGPALPGNLEFMDADSGILVEPRDHVDRYADAIVSLLGDDDRRQAMGERSRRRMLGDFSLAEMGRRHGELYDDLLSKRKARQAPARELSPLGSIPLSRNPRPSPTVGVIVPCYRHGMFLGTCIDSIKGQTLSPAHIVVVDDGSDDTETIEALDGLERDPEISVVRQEVNLGPSAARNRGLDRLDTGYVLPIDADDELLPDALERMLAQLEAAPEDIGFIYPNIQYFGNQSNYVRSPTYNLWLLMQQNYCPAPALFDRRVFDGTGVHYPEEMVVGHEDWDLILQLAERGVRGLPADGPTFRYRKQGFSRANAVDYAPAAFDRTIEDRHPRLYDDSAEIKANWSPALSIVLLDDDNRGWTAGDLSGLARQTCRDFELLSRAESIDGAIAVTVDSDSPFAWLQHAIHRARGRWILLLPRSVAAVLDSPSFVGQLLHTFFANEEVLGTVLAESAGEPRRSLAQLNDVERLSASPAAVCFERRSWGRIQELPLSLGESPLADVVTGLQTQGPLQWRSVRASEPGAPWRRRAWGDAPSSVALDVNLPATDGPGIAARRMILHQPPRLPELAVGAIRGRKRSDPWMPSQSLLLFRHLNPATGTRIVIPGEEPPPGHVLERVLGSSHRFPTPGAERLIQVGGHFSRSTEQGDLGEGEYDLGYVEQQRLPMLDILALRRIPGSGQEVLVAGTDDPLAQNSELIENLGWIEPCPILPRASDILHTGPWAVISLRRQVDYATWRHSYRVGAPGEVGDAVELGSLCRYFGPGTVGLRLRPDGRLVSELVTPGRASRDPRKIGRWLAEPFAADTQMIARTRGAASRLRHLARHSRSRRMAEEEGEILGYLPRALMPGCSILYSTIHPVTGDQLVTRSPEEALAAGYVMDGILGAIFDPPDGASTSPEEMPWARVSRG